ncbi:MAG: hypothetical protein KUL87_10100 [Pseudomonas sp.]|nr:hypothetical protein [Pseudomonas sp.]
MARRALQGVGRQVRGELLGFGQLRGFTFMRTDESHGAMPVVAGVGDGDAIEDNGGGEAQRLFAGELCDL